MSYIEIQAKDLKPGDHILTRYYDADGAYQEADVPVESVKVFRVNVRVACGDGWGNLTFPARTTLGVLDTDEAAAEYITDLFAETADDYATLEV